MYILMSLDLLDYESIPDFEEQQDIIFGFLIILKITMMIHQSLGITAHANRAQELWALVETSLAYCGI